jgi:hypothetical protein
MKAILFAAALLAAASPAAAECVRTPAGRTVCRNAAGEVVAPVTPVAPGAAGVTTYSRGASAVETPYGGAAYNPRTGNAAVAHTNPNGVTTTETARGGEAKTKNGMGVVHGPGGTTCAKGRGEGHCN